MMMLGCFDGSRLMLRLIGAKAEKMLGKKFENRTTMKAQSVSDLQFTADQSVCDLLSAPSVLKPEFVVSA